MGFTTKIQLIKRKNSAQFYVNFTTQVAQLLEFEKGEEFEWLFENKNLLKLKRKNK